MAEPLEDLVWRRAGSTCEYCRMPQAFDSRPFQIDHIIAQQHGGETNPDNLALSCLRCNKHKGPNLAGIDPETGRIVRLFHPRRDRWRRHFFRDGPALIGKTAIGRATIAVLAIDSPGAVEARAALIGEGAIPPHEP